MSMLSAQCDELRTLADLYDIMRKPANARTLRDAADTILSLRDRAQALQAENAKLRELVADTLMQPRDYCQKYDIEYDSWDSVNEHLDARLRELGVEVEQ